MWDGRREKCFQNFQQIFNIPPVIDDEKRERHEKGRVKRDLTLLCVLIEIYSFVLLFFFRCFSGVFALEREWMVKKISKHGGKGSENVKFQKFKRMEH